jgi:hypothetical protein
MPQMQDPCGAADEKDEVNASELPSRGDTRRG